MPKELRGIIEKMVSENPDIMQIATDWSPSNIGTTIWVQFPSIEDQELANQFMEKYTDYVNDLFTPDYMYDDSHTLVFPQLERFDDDPNTPLVYDKKRGIIDAVSVSYTHLTLPTICSV